MAPVGFDVGESKLLVGCALRDNTPVDSLFVDGGRVRHLRERQASTEDRLKPRYASNLCDDLVWGRWQDVIKDEKEKASHRAVEYASQFENPVNVFEQLDGITDGDIGKYWNRRLGRWLFFRLQSRIKERAAEHGIAVEYAYVHVYSRHTSKMCHACQHWVSTASGYVQMYERYVWGVGVPGGSERSSEQSQSAQSVGREPASETGRR